MGRRWTWGAAGKRKGDGVEGFLPVVFVGRRQCRGGGRGEEGGGIHFYCFLLYCVVMVGVVAAIGTVSALFILVLPGT